MKQWIQQIIGNFIREYEKNTVTKWGSPLVGFADAVKVKQQAAVIGENHGVPEDAVDDASVVIAYFVPFLKEMADTNKEKGLASAEWACAYEETNIMLGKINEHLISTLEEKGYTAAVHPEAGNFDRKKLTSNWSHRHIAYLAGLGTFGINNMLITERGCCGRYSTVVTNLDVEPDHPRSDDLCIYKAYGSCRACINECPAGALKTDRFERHKCYEMCIKNAEIHNTFGNSYSAPGETAAGSEVCGKCIAGMPCAFL